MNAYVYAADLYCEDCGEDIRATLLRDGCEFDVDDEYSYDSDDFPKGPYSDGGGESDCPNHCGSGEDCINAIELSDGRKIGAFLENPLTSDGYEYVKEAIREGGEVAKLWAEFYEIDSPKKYKLSVSHEYSGMIGYWGGNSRRWDFDAGCLFAHYSSDTTVRELVDEFVDDFESGGDCFDWPTHITGKDVRQAIYNDLLNDEGRKAYDENALSDFALEFAEASGLEPGIPLDEQTGGPGIIDDLSVWIILITYEEEEEDAHESSLDS